jgi:hypothetical protein
MIDLGDHRIQGPPDAFYIPNFVTPEEEKYLMRKVCMLHLIKWNTSVSHDSIDHRVSATEVEISSESPVCDRRRFHLC